VESAILKEKGGKEKGLEGRGWIRGGENALDDFQFWEDHQINTKGKGKKEGMRSVTTDNETARELHQLITVEVYIRNHICGRTTMSSRINKGKR